MLPEVEHWSNSYEIVEYLRALQASVAPVEFEVGMSTRSRRWVFRRRVEVGGQFFTTGPVMDPGERARGGRRRLELRPDDPPVYLEITPPMSERWVKRLESVGALPVSDELRDRLHGLSESEGRKVGWAAAKEAAELRAGVRIRRDRADGPALRDRRRRGLRRVARLRAQASIRVMLAPIATSLASICS